jgi:hypothetical protein
VLCSLSFEECLLFSKIKELKTKSIFFFIYEQNRKLKIDRRKLGKTVAFSATEEGARTTLEG